MMTQLGNSAFCSKLFEDLRVSDLVQILLKIKNNWQVNQMNIYIKKSKNQHKTV